MTNLHSKPQRLIEQFLLGQLTVEEEKELLNWIDSNPESIITLKKEQNRLRSIISSHTGESTDKQWNRLLAKIETRLPIRRNKTKKLRLFIGATTIAASLVVGLFLYSTFSENQQNVQNTILTYNSISTTLGERTNLILPDGTKVNLNAGSNLRYPSTFTATERKVELSGEAFFDVVRNENYPFIVKTQALSVRVLGTKFNLEAFPEASAINTTLVSGKVIIEKELNQKMILLAEMKPNDRAIYQKDDQEISLSTEKDINQYIAWKDGKLVFLNDPIEEVAKKLGLWYNVSVVIQSEELKKSHFTGTFTNETMEKVLTLLSVSSPIDYKINENTNRGANSPKRQIILTSRR